MSTPALLIIDDEEMAFKNEFRVFFPDKSGVGSPWLQRKPPR